MLYIPVPSSFINVLLRLNLLTKHRATGPIELENFCLENHNKLIFQEKRKT